MKRTFTTRRGLAGWVTGRGPEVLLLHGGPGMTDYMQSLLPELDGYQVASFQQRGVAPSTLSGPFDVPTLRDDVIEVLDTLSWESPVIIGHSWGGHLLLHLLAVTPTRVGAALVVDPLGAVGDGGLAAFQAELERRLPKATNARLKQLDDIEATRALTQKEHLEAMEISWPGYFSSLEVAQPIPQTDHAPSDESGPPSAPKSSRPRPIAAGLQSADSVRARRTGSPACDREHGHGRDDGRTHGRPSGQRSLPLARGLRLCAP